MCYLRVTSWCYRKHTDNSYSEKQMSTFAVCYSFMARVDKIYLCSGTPKYNPHLCLLSPDILILCICSPYFSIFDSLVPLSIFVKTILLFSVVCVPLLKTSVHVFCYMQEQPLSKLLFSMVSVTCVHLCCKNIMSKFI